MKIAKRSFKAFTYIRVTQRSITTYTIVRGNYKQCNKHWHFHLKKKEDLKAPQNISLWPVWQDWAIYWTLGKFLKPLATTNLPKLGNFCQGVKIYHFPSEIIFGHFYRLLAIFFWSRCLWQTQTIEGRQETS